MKPAAAGRVHRPMDALLLRRPRTGRPHLVAFVAIIVLLGLALLAERLAHAELAGIPSTVTEAGCDVSVELDGPIARVTETHRLVATTDVPTAAVYGAALARDAVVDGFTVMLAGREEAGVLVPVESLGNRTPASLGLAPDPGTLSISLHDARPVIEARVYPVSPSKVTGFTVRWSAPLAYDRGEMTLELPARGRGDNLGRCAVRVVARTAAGIKSWASVRAGDVWIGAGPKVRGNVAGAPAAEDFLIEARPVWAGTAPVLAAAHAPDGRSVSSTVAVYVPDGSSRARFVPARLLFVVDTSRSMGAEGRRAAVALIETAIRAAPAGTMVDAVLFDRRARRALGTWQAGDTGAAARLTRAVQDAPVASGTDLAAALSVAAAALGGERAHVMIITDGVLPTGHSGSELLGHFSTPAGKVVVDVLIPLAAGAAAPERGALESLVQVYGGRVAAFPADQPVPAAALTEGSIAGPPLEQLRLAADGAEVDGLELPDLLAAGSGIVVRTSLARRPGRLSLRARRGAADLDIAAIALPAGAARFATAARVDENPDPRAGLALARRQGVLGSTTAYIVFDGRAAGVAARRDAARRTGAITYTPPPEVPDLATVATQAAPPPHGGAKRRPGVAGELPRTSVQLALRDHLVPRLRACYRDALRATPALGGDLIVELEIARAEVMAVSFAGDHFPEAMIGCAADAAYAMATPGYALGDTTDTVFVIRKPITFAPPASSSEEPTVALDEVLYPATNPAGRPAVEVEAEAPL